MTAHPSQHFRISEDRPLRIFDDVFIKQKVHVKDRLALKLDKVRVPFRATLPIKVHVPLKQILQVTGQAVVPLKQRITVPLRQTIHPVLDDELSITAKRTGTVPAHLKAELEAKVAVEQAVFTRVGDLRLRSNDLSVQRTSSPEPSATSSPCR